MKKNPTMIILLCCLVAMFVLCGLLLDQSPVEAKHDNSRLYFAYGSNLDEDQMAERCLTAEVYGVAQIMGYRFVINERGVASILESPGDVVEGVLWTISPLDERLLDLYEGVAEGYYVKEDLAMEERASGLILEALVYVATNSGLGAPRPGYLEKVIRAAQSHGLTERYISELSTWQ